MYTIGICDDEEIYRSEITDYVNTISLKHDLNFKIMQYQSGKQIKVDKKLDILILDIEMENMDGLQVRDMLEENESDTFIIYCTSHGEAMGEAYGKNVIGFIQKPVKEADIEKKLLHAIELINKKVKCVGFNTINGLTKLQVSNIAYGDSQDRYVRLYTMDGESYFITDKGISQVYEMLKDMNFARISRSTIVNLENVNSIGDKVYMANGIKLKYSHRRKKQIQDDFFDYMCKIARVED